MNAVCHKQLRFESIFGKQVTVDFDGGHITSDAGGLLLRELDKRYRLTEGVAKCLADPRHDSWVIHELTTLVKQRIFSIYNVSVRSGQFQLIKGVSWTLKRVML